MKKLELKHVAPYLPYELLIFDSHFGRKNIKMVLENDTFDISKGVKVQDVLGGECFKPILRPISDLIKEIEVNGKKFVPVEYLNDNYYVQFSNDIEDINELRPADGLREFYLDDILEFTSKLFEWHFDVFGLIKDNLATDINTLKK